MPDDTSSFDPTTLEEIAKYGIGAGSVAGANQAQLAAYDAVLNNLGQRFSDYSNLKTPGYQNLTAQHLGPSQLGSIQMDPQARVDEQAAEAQLQDIANRGGLSLADRASLNNIESTLSRNAQARNNSLANQFAAKGQFGSGAQMAMELANNQNAAQNANQHGEDIAAQAQQRAMDAVLKKGAMSRELANDDYSRKAQAAQANDAIARYNASMATDASKYNNSIMGQGYADQLAKLQGENQLTGQLDQAILGRGGQQAAGIAGTGSMGMSLLDSLMKNNKTGGPKGGTNNNGDPTSTTTTDGNTTTVTNSDGSSTTGTVTDNPSTDTGTDPTGGGTDSWGSLLDEGSY